jgi:hypothetical protein
MEDMRAQAFKLQQARGEDQRVDELLAWDDLYLKLRGVFREILQATPGREQ